MLPGTMGRQEQSSSFRPEYRKPEGVVIDQLNRIKAKDRERWAFLVVNNGVVFDKMLRTLRGEEIN